MKVSGGSAVLGYEHQSAGFAVESGDDRDLTPVRDFEGKQLSELMPQRHGSVRLRRMDEQMGGFVDHEKGGVFVEDAGAAGSDWWLAGHEQADAKQISPQRHKEHEGLTVRERFVF